MCHYTFLIIISVRGNICIERFYRLEEVPKSVGSVDFRIIPKCSFGGHTFCPEMFTSL